MKLIELTVREFLNEVDSAKPAPGGGSVSALAIAQGIGLLRMVAHLTINKKKFLGLNETIKQDYLRRMNQLENLKEEVLLFIDKDTEAFNQIMLAYKMPKDTPEEEELRNEAIHNGTILATEIPYQVCNLALEAIEVANPMFQYANKNATSDFGVGMMLVNAGLVGAALNVRTNMAGFANQDLADKFLNEVLDFENRAKVMVDNAMIAVNQAFK